MASGLKRAQPDTAEDSDQGSPKIRKVNKPDNSSGDTALPQNGSSLPAAISRSPMWPTRETSESQHRNEVASNEVANGHVIPSLAGSIQSVQAGPVPDRQPTASARFARPNRVKPTAVKIETDSGIKKPRGTTKPTAMQQKWVDALKKAKDQYRYDPIKEDQVRLLVLIPGRGDEDINATLLPVHDDELGSEDYPYEALSYHWGEGGEDHTIIMQDDIEAGPIKSFEDAVRGIMTAEGLGAKRLYIRPNLYEALKCLRDPQRNISLWVDALCINQPDNQEKTHQIMKMATIYRKAETVCVWLGPADEVSRDAMRFIKDVIDQKKLEELVKEDKHIPRWLSLFQLLKWSWFSRRWVIQELALAKEVTVHCGDLGIHWKDFRDAIGIFHRYFGALRSRIQDPNIAKIPVSDLEPIGAKLLVDISSNLFRRKPNGEFVSTMGIETLVSLLAGFDTADPRDTINALRNIARESNKVTSVKGPDLENPSLVPRRAALPVPNYQLDLYQVYREFIEWVIEASQSLDIICRYWALPEKESLEPRGPTDAPRLVKLPSWILTVDNGPYGKAGEAFKGRTGGENFVGLPGRGCYNASGRTPPNVKFGEDKMPRSPDGSLVQGRDMSLLVDGLQIGRVEWRSDPIPDGVIPKQSLEKLGWSQETTSNGGAELAEAPDQLWRVLVADKGPNGGDVPVYYHRACLYCLLNITPNGHINTEKILSRNEFKDQQSIVQDYLERVRDVTWNRVILQGTAEEEGSPNPYSDCVDNLVGLGPPKTQTGDVIAILYGCSVPVILHPTNSPPHGGAPESYEFVGEAYIYGKMDGEALDIPVPKKQFKLI